MNTNVLSDIANLLKNYKYGYMRYQGKRPSTYWVGEYSTSEHQFESGHNKDEFILTGTTDGNFSSLETEKAAIIKILDNARFANSSYGWAMNFERALNIPTETDNIKRVELHFSLDTWEK